MLQQKKLASSLVISFFKFYFLFIQKIKLTILRSKINFKESYIFIGIMSQSVMYHGWYNFKVEISCLNQLERLQAWSTAYQVFDAGIVTLEKDAHHFWIVSLCVYLLQKNLLWMQARRNKHTSLQPHDFCSKLCPNSHYSDSTQTSEGKEEKCQTEKLHPTPN